MAHMPCETGHSVQSTTSARLQGSHLILNNTLSRVDNLLGHSLRHYTHGFGLSNGSENSHQALEAVA